MWFKERKGGRGGGGTHASGSFGRDGERDGRGRRRTHQVLTDPAAGADLDVVPGDEQDQGERQHVELPVPDHHHEHLRGHMISGVSKQPALH